MNLSRSQAFKSGPITASWKSETLIDGIFSVIPGGSTPNKKFSLDLEDYRQAEISDQKFALSFLHEGKRYDDGDATPEAVLWSYQEMRARGVTEIKITDHRGTELT